MPQAQFTPIAPETDTLIGRTSDEISSRYDNRTPSAATWSAWCHQGLHGIKLPSVVVGGRRLTTVRSFAEWILATTFAVDGEAACETTAVGQAARQRATAYETATARNLSRFTPKKSGRKPARARRTNC